MVWRVLEGSAGFARFCEAMVSFERLWKVLEALDGFVMLWESLALEGFRKLLKSLGGFGRLWLQHSTPPQYVSHRGSGRVGKFWMPLGSCGKL